MHVEMSLDNDSGEKSAPSRENATDTQTISGSQVATAFARIESNSQQKAPGRIHALLISTAAVMSVVGLYLLVVFAL